MAKQEEIKIRVTAEEKSLIKEAAKLQGVTMSKFILDNIVPTAKKQIFNIEHKDIIEKKFSDTEQQLQKIKKNLEERKVKPKSLFKIVFARK